MSLWAYLSWSMWLLVVAAAALLRSSAYAIFRGVLLSIHTLVALALLPHVPLKGLYLSLHLLVYFDSLMLIRARMRPSWYRYLIELPAHYMAASTFMAFPWALLAAFGVAPYGYIVPYALGLIGLYQSLNARREEKRLFVGDVKATSRLVRFPEQQRSDEKEAPLRVAQLTDPHLGPFMTVRRLRAICERIVAQDPDLCLLTGDFLTMESQSDKRNLSEALAPLADLKGRVFACMGNHDHEAPSIVTEALSSISARLLIDESVLVETGKGKVQIVGLDFHFTKRAERISEVLEKHPRLTSALRLVLLHDPGAFKHIARGDADLVLSGHTHGGQVGLFSLGWPWTVAGWITKIPDHGLWANGTNRLYVHRGTGHYGFPLRLGVPAEESLLFVHQI